VTSGSVAMLYRVQVLDRTVGILQALADAHTDLGPAEIAQRLALHKSTIHRLLASLERYGYIRRQPASGKYGLGLKLFELGSRAVARLNLHGYAQPILEQLVAETGETAHLAVMDRGQMVSVVIAESPRTVRTPATVGRRTPMHCTAVGKAMLASLPEPAVTALLEQHPLQAYTRKTLTTRAALSADLDRIRKRGYAVDDEEIEDGLRCVGAAVRNHSGNVIASLSIAGPAFRVGRARIAALGRVVVGAADRLSVNLGYHPPQQTASADAARSNLGSSA
jgi:DNA-binding IclR family transcriptional regulator